MTLRVTQSMTQEAFLTAVRRQLGQLQATQQQVSSGERIARPSDDPVAYAQLLGIDTALAEGGQFARNIDLARNRLASVEGAMSRTTDSLQRLRELAVQAATGTANRESRRVAAAEFRQQLDSILQVANSTDDSGDYLFAGYSSQTRPFSRDASGTVVYNGDQGQRQFQIGPDRFVSAGEPGSLAFQQIKDGNGTFATAAAAANVGTGVLGARSVVDFQQWDGGTYTVSFTAPGAYEVRDAGAALVSTGTFTPGATLGFRGVEITIEGQPAVGDTFNVRPSQNLDVFTAIDRFISALESAADDSAGRARFSDAANAFLENVDQSIAHMSQVRATVGGNLAGIEAQQSINEDTDAQLQTLRSELKDTDYAEALSRLSQQLLSLEAAQKSYVQTQSLSLFNYL
jgi:flagellar hook-associated protein 3 FlgL